MKRIGLFVLLAFSYLGCGAVPGLLVSMEGNFPSAYLGVGPSTSLSLVNDTPLYGVVIVHDSQRIKGFNPGTTMSGKFTLPLERIPAPIIVQWFDSPLRINMVGMSWRVPWVTRGGPTTEVFHLSDVTFLDGHQGGSRLSYPAPLAGRDTTVEMSHIDRRSTTVLQIANCTRFSVRGSINDIPIVFEGDKSGNASLIAPGSVTTTVKWDMSWRHEWHVVLKVLDGGRIIGTQRYDFTSTPNDPKGEQVVVTPYSFSRQ